MGVNEGLWRIWVVRAGFYGCLMMGLITHSSLWGGGGKEGEGWMGYVVL